MCQCFREHRETCVWFPCGPICFSEKRQKIGAIGLYCRGTKGAQALVHLLDPFLRLSLLCQRPAVQNSTVRRPERKSLFRSEMHGGCGTLQCDPPLATALMKHGSPAQGKTEAKRVCALLCQGHRLLVPRQPLVRIAQK